MDAWSAMESTIDFWHEDYCETLCRGVPEVSRREKKSFDLEPGRRVLISSRKWKRSRYLYKKKKSQPLFRVHKFLFGQTKWNIFSDAIKGRSLGCVSLYSSLSVNNVTVFDDVRACTVH